jgi:hypothetical protein
VTTSQTQVRGQATIVAEFVGFQELKQVTAKSEKEQGFKDWILSFCCWVLPGTARVSARRHYLVLFLFFECLVFMVALAP